MQIFHITNEQIILYKREPQGKQLIFHVVFKHDICNDDIIIVVSAVNTSFAALKAIAYFDLNPNINLNCWQLHSVTQQPTNTFTPEQLAVLTTVNKYLVEKGLSPLSEAEIRDWNITGNETDAECEQLAHDLASEEHSNRCDNKFWEENDWQNDY